METLEQMGIELREQFEKEAKAILYSTGQYWIDYAAWLERKIVAEKQEGRGEFIECSRSMAVSLLKEISNEVRGATKVRIHLFLKSQEAFFAPKNQNPMDCISVPGLPCEPLIKP